MKMRLPDALGGGVCDLLSELNSGTLAAVHVPGVGTLSVPWALLKVEVIYLLWSHKHEAWWAPDARGYTEDEAKAGRYTEAEAVRYVVQSAQCGNLAQVTSMVAAPDNWRP